MPVPPSKCRDDPEYDSRISDIIRGIVKPNPIDIRELVIQKESTIAAHEAGEGERPTVQELLEIYEIDETLIEPEPKAIAIVDDVLTAGTHFRAMHTILSGRFPNILIIGVFIARRVFPPDEV